MSAPPGILSAPGAQAPTRTDRLWRTTCFELFLQRQGEEGYFEFNFSPSRQWAAYRSEGYRRGGEDLVIDPPVVQMGEMGLRALYDGAPFVTGGPWWAGLSAVIEEVDGTKSYWALAHASDKPDFHNPQSFLLELP